MENFIVSARKYRPDNFESVVGQGAITQTLKNAIKNQQIAQAYLFCGPRGVGKTTCARIYAKILNCKNLTSSIEACNECESCQSFNQSRSYNIHELDAASNNSVDDIRNLIDQVRIPPQIGKYSVYIIDEVHMLSQQAFNAFLKTLEEPPKHAVFILATTEKHKIIPTILSRCQIFDFNRIKIDDIVKFLEQIAIKEKISYEREAFHIIAQKADGAMRDALSIFDQVVSFSENNISYNQVIENLNVLDYEYYFKQVDAFLKNDVAQTLLIFDEILDNGFDGHQFINGLSAHLRDLLVCKDSSTVQLLEVGETIKDKYLQQSVMCENDFLYNSLAIINDCDINYKISNNKRLHVELALIKLANLSDSKKKNRLEENSVSVVKEEADNKPEITVVNENQAEIKKIDKPVAKSQKKTNISIKDALNPIKINDISEKNADFNIIEAKENNIFSEKELITKWSEFGESIKNSKPRLYSTLSSSTPIINENNIIEFTVANPLQKEAIKDVLKDLLYFLKKTLKNNTINLEILVEETKQEQKLYTQEDKFKYMSEKNKNLGLLKQKFNLDFE
ncbi:MAG: DNA polymerase III subunit gamma/tau [Bacteroidales bacterium]|nr:DNA polymerase III subunit gamma/tau [Bacteroidales bacterium]